MTTVPQSYFQERIGISAVAQAMARMGLIWRETPTGDIGIDGHVEYVDSQGRGTGQIIAVQVKCGPSYFKDGGADWIFTPKPKHRAYWELYPLPVLVVMHDPDSHLTYWTDARQQLLNPAFTAPHIRVPKAQVLESSTPTALFAAFGVTGRGFLTVPDVLDELLRRRSKNASFPVSYLSLFAHGLTNICRSLYFAMDLADTIAEAALLLDEAPTGLGVGPDDHEFLFGYVVFITEQQIADVQFSDCLVDWHDRQMQPRFLAPLTSRGRALVDLIGQYDAQLNATEPAYASGLRVAQESFVQMVFMNSSLMRIPMVRDFERRLPAVLAEGTG